MWPSDAGHRSKMEEKLGKVRQQGYILPGEVQSLTGFFAVPKGEDDTWIVYDATACGLNSALWAPNFALPTIDSVLQNADSSTWFSDIDLGKCSLIISLMRIYDHMQVWTYEKWVEVNGNDGKGR